MPKPVRVLLEALGASGADDELSLDGAAFELESLFGGALQGDVQAKIFSEEAFGFTAPDELAVLNVFWAPHLETKPQLLAAVRDAHERMKRRLEEDGDVLARLGFRPKLEPPHARCFGIGSISGHAVDLSLTASGELHLEQVDGARVPEAQRELVREAATAKENAVHAVVDERVAALIESKAIQLPSDDYPVPKQGAPNYDPDEFEEQMATAQVSPEGDAGTELLSESEAAAASELSEADREALRAMRVEELLEDSDEDEPIEDEPVVAKPPPAPKPAAQAKPNAKAKPKRDPKEDLFAEMDALAGTARPQDTIPPDNLDVMATVGEERASEDSGSTGEDPEAAAKASEDAGAVMPAPDEATQLRPLDPSARDSSSDDAAPASEEAAMAGRFGADGHDDDDGDDDVQDIGPSLEDLEEEEGVESPGLDLQPDPSRPASDVDASDRGARDVGASDVDASDRGASDRGASDRGAGDVDASDVDVGAVGASDVDASDEDEPTIARAPQGPPSGMDVDDSSLEESGATMQESREFVPPGKDEADDVDSDEDVLAALDDAAAGAILDPDVEGDATDPTLPLLNKRSEREEPEDNLLNAAAAGVFGEESSEEYEIEEVERFNDPPVAGAASTAPGEVDDYGQTEQDWEAPSADNDRPPPDDANFAALADIVGDGISSGKTGAIELDAAAFDMLRQAAGKAAVNDAGDDPDELVREAEQLEARARELRAKADLLRERMAEEQRRGARSLKQRMEKERASLEDDAVEPDDAATDPAPAPEPEPASERPAMAADDVGAADDFDAFSDGVDLADLQAILDAEEQKVLPSDDGYAATQLAEMDLGDLDPAPSGGGDVFGDAEDSSSSLAPERTGRNPELISSVESLPQAMSADVESLASMDARAESTGVGASLADSASNSDSQTAFVPPDEVERASAPERTAVGLVVTDARARARLKKHLEITLPEVREIGAADEAADRADLAEFLAIVFVRPPADESTVASLEQLLGTPSRPPVLVVSSDPVFDAMAGVDLRVALGRRASEVAQSVLDGLTRLGVGSAA